MRGRVRHLNPAKAGATVCLDSRFLTGFADGDSVGTWTGRAGTSVNATQASGSLKPLYKTSVTINGNPVVKFDGTDDEMVTPDLSLSQPYTIVAATRVNSIGSGYNSFCDSSNGNALLFANVAGSTKLAVYAGSQISHATAISINNNFVCSGVFNGTSSLVCLNGGSPVTGNAGTGGYAAVRLGTNWNESAFHSNAQGAVAIFPSALSNALRRRIEHSFALSFRIACA